MERLWDNVLVTLIGFGYGYDGMVREYHSVVTINLAKRLEIPIRKFIIFPLFVICLLIIGLCNISRSFLLPNYPFLLIFVAVLLPI
jgi:F0F1-type ATP synthase assembly protein I